MVRSNPTSVSSPLLPDGAPEAPRAPVGRSVPPVRTRGKPLPIDYSPAGVSTAHPARGAPPIDPSALPSVEGAAARAERPSSSAAAADVAAAVADCGDYEVGYKKPPKDTQFKPGQSGNSKGRAKGSRNLATIVEDIASEQITVRENGKSRKMSKLEIVVKKLVSDALQGNAKATAQLMRILKDLGQFDNPAKSDARLAAEREESLNAFQQDILDDFVVKRFAELRPSASDATPPPASASETIGEFADSEPAAEVGVSEVSDEFEDDLSEPVEEERKTITLEQHIRKYGEIEPRILRAIKDD